MRVSLIKLGFVGAMGLVAAVGCGDDETTSTTTSSSGSSSSSSSSGTTTTSSSGSGGSSSTTTSTGAGGSMTSVHGCTKGIASDQTGNATIDIAWSNPHSSCVIVDAGTTVNFNGNFTAHPLAGGESPTEDSGSDISTASAAGMTTAVTFNTAGDYPYFCTIHASTMTGVVYVE
jgi:plastocyanin